MTACLTKAQALHALIEMETVSRTLALRDALGVEIVL